MYYYLLPVLLFIVNIGACKKDLLTVINPTGKTQRSFPSSVRADSMVNPTDSIVTVLYQRDVAQGLNISINDHLRGGKFVYKPASSGLVADNGIIFLSKNGGFWERETGDTIKLAWFNINTANTDNAAIIRNGMQAAINRHASVITFPFAGTYSVKSGNYWTVPDKINLQIDGKGAVIEVAKEAAEVAQETYVMAFKCTETSNSLNSKISIKNLNIKAPAIEPQWTNTDYHEHKLVMAIETDGIYTVNINNCTLNNICGYGIRLKNFVAANLDHVIEKNVGGHFPVENGFDSFGDGIWLGHYDVETVRTSRKSSYAKITNCVIQGYDTGTNGNFASRCGITVEGFASHAPDIIVKVDVSNCTISDYDRNLHVEGISSNINYTNCKLRNFFGIALVVNSVKTALTYDNCDAAGLLLANPKQERYGLGGAMQFGSYFDLVLTNKTVFKFNGPASFRANLYIRDGSVLDFGNSDVFFDHANIYVNTGGSMINLPGNVGRGYNMYGGSVKFNKGNFSAFNKAPGDKGVFHGENIDSASIIGCKLNNSKLYFTGGCGTVTMDSN